MKYLKGRFNMELLVVPLVVRVFPLVHVWQFLIRKLTTKLKIASMTYIKVALGTKQNAIAEKVRATILQWFSVMWLPAPVFAFGSIGSTDVLATGSTQSSLPFPCLLYSVGRKGQNSTSRVEVANPRVKNGWIRNEDMWVLLRDGKSYNIAVTYTPPWERRKGGYSILKGSKVIGTSRTLEAAKRRAEKIKIPKRPFN